MAKEKTKSAPFTSTLKQKLNGLRSTVEGTWGLKKDIENRDELTPEEKQARLEALRNEQLEKFRQDWRELSNFLYKNKINEDEIPEDEPKSTSKAQQAQDRARVRLEGLEDPNEIVNAIQSELEDETKPEDYQRAVFRIGKTKLEAKGSGDYHNQKLKRLRRKHLLDDDTVGQLRKTEAIEDLEPQVRFAKNYLKDQLAEGVFNELENRNGPGVPNSRGEHAKMIDKVFEPIKTAVVRTIEKHKPKSNGAG